MPRFSPSRLHAAGHEEQEQQAGEAEADPLERAEQRRRHRARLGRRRLGEGHLVAVIVSPRAVSMPAAVADGLLQRVEDRRGDRLVDQQRDVELVDRAGGDLGLGDLLVDAVSVALFLRL